MHYLVYQIINKLNGKYYIGVHRTKNIDDGYMGSGALIKRAIEKHGIENFTKTILFDCASAEEMFEHERELVDPSDSMSYNMKAGGIGGWDHIDASEHMTRVWNDPEYRVRGLAMLREAAKKARSLPHHRTWLGRTHTEETKRKMRKSKNVGATNSQHGTMWITNGSENRKVRRDQPIPDGFSPGRKINHA